MKKLVIMISAIISVQLLFSACDKINDKEVINGGADISEYSSEGDETREPTLAQRDRSADAETDFVFDDAGLLSESDYSKLNEYTAWLSETFKINVAVVTASDIGGKTPEEYASDYYNELYGGSNGVVFLVNDDTGEDYLLRNGVPSLFISESGIEMLFSEISPLLVTGQYSDAVQRTLEYIELSLPEFAIDRTNELSKEDILDVNDILSSACGDDESLSMIFIGDIGDRKIEDYAEEQADKYFKDGSDCALMIVNTEKGEYYICGQGSFSSLEEGLDSIGDSVAECMTEADGKKSFDYLKSAEIFANFAGQ